MRHLGLVILMILILLPGIVFAQELMPTEVDVPTKIGELQHKTDVIRQEIRKNTERDTNWRVEIKNVRQGLTYAKKERDRIETKVDTQETMINDLQKQFNPAKITQIEKRVDNLSLMTAINLVVILIVTISFGIILMTILLPKSKSHGSHSASPTTDEVKNTAQNIKEHVPSTIKKAMIADARHHQKAIWANNDASISTSSKVETDEINHPDNVQEGDLTNWFADTVVEKSEIITDQEEAIQSTAQVNPTIEKKQSEIEKLRAVAKLKQEALEQSEKEPEIKVVLTHKERLREEFK